MIYADPPWRYQTWKGQGVAERHYPTMPLEDINISREPDGTFNEEYCKWCYADGKFVYTSLEELLNFLERHMANETWPSEQVRAYFEAQLPKLNHWKQPEA